MPDLRDTESPIPEGAEEANELLETTRRTTGILGTIRNVVIGIFVIVAGGLIAQYVTERYIKPGELKRDQLLAFADDAKSERDDIQKTANENRAAFEDVEAAMAAGADVNAVNAKVAALDGKAKDFQDALTNFQTHVKDQADHVGHAELKDFSDYADVLKLRAYAYRQCIDDYAAHYNDAGDAQSAPGSPAQPPNGAAQLACSDRADGYYFLREAMEVQQDCEDVLERQISQMVDAVKLEADRGLTSVAGGADPFWAGVHGALDQYCGADVLKMKPHHYADNPAPFYPHPRQPPQSALAPAEPPTAPALPPASSTAPAANGAPAGQSPQDQPPAQPTPQP